MNGLDDPIRLIPVHQVEVAVSILAETEDYNHQLMNIPAIWKRTKGAGVKLAVLDTGLPNHMDIKPSGGKSFVQGYLEDKNGHATHCGGIIAATAYNDMGIRGIAPDVEDYYGAVMGADGSGTVNQIIAGIRWAVDDIGADIISMSLGISAYAPYIPELEAACKYAVDRGVAIFAASGNEGGNVGQPARYDCVYAIAAIDERMDLASFSNRGKEIDFAAGGVQVFSTYLRNTYARLNGTSMACPAIAAVGALILADAKAGQNPRKLTPTELGAKIQKIAYDLGPAGTDMFYGAGIPIFSAWSDVTGTPPPLPPKKSWWKRWLGLCRG